MWNGKMKGTVGDGIDGRSGMKNLKIFAKTIDEKAKAQIYTLLEQPAFADCKVRIMPDVHAGAGCVIGFTADLGDKVIPNMVGVDIGCGMLTVELGKIDIDFAKLDSVIRENIPVGMNVNDTPVRAPQGHIEDLLCYDRLHNKDWLERSMCSLGGGNHFIEIDADDDGNKYLVIHTGSRNVGKQVCEIYQDIAIYNLHGNGARKRECDKLIAEYKATGRQSEIADGIAQIKKNFGGSIPKDLCYIEGKDRSMYLHDMAVCQAFADWNRTYIARRICEKMGWDENNNFTTIHNYIDHESNIVRKGAISAKNGERVLIPINMRDGCIIGVGKGNEDWNCSAPHGAGRIMSRSQARESLNIEDYEKVMDGIYTTSVCKETIDEAPQVYKPLQEIVECVHDTVEIERIIKPVYNFKASEA